MRHAILLSLLGLGACANQPSPDRLFPVFFNEYSVELDASSLAVIARAASISKLHPGRVVHVGGYADPVGTPNETIRLSQRRADVVAAQLQADGVAASVLARSAIGSPANSQPGIERRRVVIDIDI